MKVFFLWHYYPRYLRSFHADRPHLTGLSFDEHRRELLADHYAWHAELAEFMQRKGFDTDFVVANAETLQKKWAIENELQLSAQPRWEQSIAIAQILRCRPDAVWVSQHYLHDKEFIRAIRQHTRRIITWVGEPWSAPPGLDDVAVLVTENPATFSERHAQFDRVIVTTPGFCPDVLTMLGPAEKMYDVAFVGRFMSVHAKRTEYIAHLLRHGIKVNVWGWLDEVPPVGMAQGLRLALWYGLRKHDYRAGAFRVRQALRPSVSERNARVVSAVCRPPLFGLEMFKALRASRIVLNVHSDIAGHHAGNMRLFQSTGVGACLVTDDADNLGDLFLPGVETLAFRSKEELLETVQDALRTPEKLERVALAGQARTHREHTIERMFHDIRPAFEF
jgi:spore maturation protein CgeB